MCFAHCLFSFSAETSDNPPFFSRFAEKIGKNLDRPVLYKRGNCGIINMLCLRARIAKPLMGTGAAEFAFAESRGQVKARHANRLRITPDGPI